MHKSLSNTVSLEVILTQNIREIRKLIIWKKKRFKKKKAKFDFFSTIKFYTRQTCKKSKIQLIQILLNILMR